MKQQTVNEIAKFLHQKAIEANAGPETFDQIKDLKPRKPAKPTNGAIQSKPYQTEDKKADAKDKSHSKTSKGKGSDKSS